MNVPRKSLMIDAALGVANVSTRVSGASGVYQWVTGCVLWKNVLG